jgi:WD40 repeat protein
MKRSLWLLIIAVIVTTLIGGSFLLNRTQAKVRADASKPILTLEHDDPIKLAYWNKDATRILADGGKSVYLWNAETGSQIAKLTLTANVKSALWSLDEKFIFAYADGDDKTLWVWDGEGKVVTKIKQANPISWIRLNKDASHVVIYTKGNIVEVWDIASSKMLYKLEHEAKSNVWNSAWNSDDSKLLTYGSDGTARLWDAATGKALQKLSHEGRIAAASWNKDESRLLIINNPQITLFGAQPKYKDHVVRVWDTSTGKQLFALKHTNWVLGARWNQDETRILTNSEDKTARLWDSATGKQLAEFKHEGFVYNAQWNKDESQILTYGRDNTLKLWDAATGKNIYTLKHNASVVGTLWTKDESRLLSYSNDGSVRVWDAKTGENLLTLWHRGNVNEASWNADETQLMTRTNSAEACKIDCEHAVWMWDAVSGQPLFMVPSKAPVNDAVWDANYTRVLVVSNDKTIQVWDANAASPEPISTAIPFAGVKEGHWTSSKRISFDVDANMKIVNFEAHVPFGAGTCNIVPKGQEFDINAGGIISVLGFSGQFTSDSAIEGTYLIGFCGNTISLGSPVKWSAKWSGAASK